MLKYVDILVSFQEVPDEISLCISITNCCNMCEGCHSPWLREDSGTPLTYTELTSLIKKNKGISCVCFMGGDREPWEVVRLATLVKEDFPTLKTAWYSGSESVDHQNQFNYVKTGPYIESFGPLNSKTTNQRMVEYNLSTELGPSWYMRDITYKFWKDATH
jgi:anaerobic ribonucleoside-triphosphate reductase activating protein